MKFIIHKLNKELIILFKIKKIIITNYQLFIYKIINY